MEYIFDYKKSGVLGDIDGVILLSKSPRRRELLKFLDPIIMPVEIPERDIEKKFMDFYKDEDFLTRAAKTCSEISMAKSDLALKSGTLYISSDTMVIHEGKIYNKPRDMDEARKMFYSYFGKSHFVVTSVCLRTIDYLDVFYSISKIDFVDLYDELKEPIEAYLASKTSLDKAGAYGIQDLDPRFVRSISGDINTIIGLPVAELSYRIFGKDK